MTGDPLVAPEARITLVFMFLGLTAWYVAQTAAESDPLALGALFGIGIVLPTLINQLRRRAGPE